MDWKKITMDLKLWGSIVFLGSLVYFNYQYGILWQLEPTWIHALHIFGILLYVAAMVISGVRGITKKIKK